jgi:MHS family shikimate/dehydroshikimate transporter-like MFS transporter
VTAATTANQRRVGAATLVGTTIEYYDFFVFGTASALVFGPAFFAPTSPAIGLILALGTFGVSFLMRPIGGVIAGHLGDRYGRKVVLVWTLALMGTSTAMIGLLPTYASIGVAAPLLLVFLRLLQGLALGGEWGGAVTLAIENAPPGKRGLWGALPQMGAPLGLGLANAVTLVVSVAVSTEAFVDWGWRIPFLANVVLIALGLWVRRRVADKAGDELAARREHRTGSPVVDVFRHRAGVTVRLIGAQAGAYLGFYLFAVLALSYLTVHAGLSNTMALVAVLVGAGVNVALQPFFGKLSDRVGRKPLVIGGAVATAALAFPYYAMAGTGSPALAVLATALLLGLGHSPQFAVLSSMIGEQYEVTYRYSGASIATQLGNLMWSAGTPVLGAFLLERTAGQGWPLALLLIAGCALSVACVAGLRETRDNTDLSRPNDHAIGTPQPAAPSPTT